MAKKSKNIEEVQNITLSGFQRTIQSEKYRKEPTMVERIIAESAQKRKAFEAKQQPQPRISLYNPNNPLNGFKSKSKDEQIAITKMLKAQEKAAKAALKETENC